MTLNDLNKYIEITEQLEKIADKSFTFLQEHLYFQTDDVELYTHELTPDGLALLYRFDPLDNCYKVTIPMECLTSEDILEKHLKKMVTDHQNAEWNSIDNDARSKVLKNFVLAHQVGNKSVIDYHVRKFGMHNLLK